MSKTLRTVCILTSFALVGCLLLFLQASMQKRRVQFEIDENDTLVLSLNTGKEKEILFPWFDETTGYTYFFLPSFVEDHLIYCDYLDGNSVLINEELLSKGDRFQWENQVPYSVSYHGQEQKLVFMKSAKLPSLFLETESGSMEYLNSDKKNEEKGEVHLINTSGSTEYEGSLKRISARGNSTFAVDKKSYTFTLNEAYPIGGLDAGKKWNLLALCYEDNKIQSKIIYDMAAYLGMEYTPGATWVDLYCNGSYQGLYLLIEAITVGEGRVEIYDLEKENEKSGNPANITGGYLLERDVTESIEPTEVSFSTDIYQYNFVVSSPKNPTQEELSYIKDFTQKIENMLADQDMAYKEYLDIDSVSKQFLIDKLVLNPDAMRSSTFFYKERNLDVLKVGPLWDYDRAMGVSMPNYTISIGDYPDSMKGWYSTLYADEEFYQKLLYNYQKLLPYVKELLDTKIDAYADLLGPSIAMDTVMWPMSSIYTEHESYVRYLKYFLANRINYLNEVWGIEGPEIQVPPATEEMHTVRFYTEDGELMQTVSVKDGEPIASMPEIDGESYEWRYHLTGKSYDSYYPVYEDMELYAQRKFDSPEEYTEYKLERIRKEDSLENYLTLLQDVDLSVCVYLPSGSALLCQEEYLQSLEKLSAFQAPAQLRTAADAGFGYFMLIDNGWETVWESVNGEPLKELGTTFGVVSYDSLEDGKPHLTIQDTETDYLEALSDETAVQFVVIDRSTGSIEDVAAFTIAERIKRE